MQIISHHVRITTIVRLIFLCGLHLSCGTESSGYLTQNNECVADIDAATVADDPPVTNESPANMYGTNGTQSRLAQEFTAEDDQIIIGVALRLVADAKPGDGATVAVTSTQLYEPEVGASFYIPDNSMETDFIDEDEIPLNTMQWVYAGFDNPVELENNKRYFLTLTPEYAHSEDNRIGWGYTTGSGMLDFDINDEIWNQNSSNELRYRLVKCE